jgi:hypothetical protein
MLTDAVRRLPLAVAGAELTGSIGVQRPGDGLRDWLSPR